MWRSTEAHFHWRCLLANGSLLPTALTGQCYISFRVAIAFHHGAGLFPSTVSKVGDQGAVESRCFGLGCGVLDGEGDKGTSRTRTDDLPIQEGTTDQRGPDEKPQPDCNVDDRE